MKNTQHVTVIGAGIIGMSAAVFLQREGFDVTVIDREPAGMGCSYGNAGGVVVASVTPTVHPGMFLKIPGWLLNPLGPLTIRWRHFPKALPWFIALARHSMPNKLAAIIEARAALCLRALGDHQEILKLAKAKDLLGIEDGLNLYANERDFNATAWERAERKRFGYDARVISVGEVAEIEPDVTTDIYAASLHGGWYQLSNPYTMVVKLAEEFNRQGGEIIQDDVVDISHDGKKATSIRLQQAGCRSVSRLCIAAGAWSHEFAAKLGTRVLLEAERGYHLNIREPGIKLSRAVTMANAPGAAAPMDGFLRLAGTDEFAGNDAAPNWQRADHLWKLGKRLLPGLRDLPDDVERWMGRRPGTPDSLPVISRAPNLDNVWYAFGHGHLGLSWGPTTGRLIAEMIAGRNPNIDMAPYRADRF